MLWDHKGDNHGTRECESSMTCASEKYPSAEVRESDQLSIIHWRSHTSGRWDGNGNSLCNLMPPTETDQACKGSCGFVGTCRGKQEVAVPMGMIRLITGDNNTLLACQPRRLAGSWMCCLYVTTMDSMPPHYIKFWPRTAGCFRQVAAL